MSSTNNILAGLINYKNSSDPAALLKALQENQTVKSPDLPPPPEGSPVVLDTAPRPVQPEKPKSGINFLANALAGEYKTQTPATRSPLPSSFTVPYGLTTQQAADLRKEVTDTNVQRNTQALAERTVALEEQKTKQQQENEKARMAMDEQRFNLDKAKAERDLSLPSMVEMEIWKTKVSQAFRAEDRQAALMDLYTEAALNADPEMRKLQIQQINESMAQDKARTGIASRQAEASILSEQNQAARLRQEDERIAEAKARQEKLDKAAADQVQREIIAAQVQSLDQALELSYEKSGVQGMEEQIFNPTKFVNYVESRVASGAADKARALEYAAPILDQYPEAKNSLIDKLANI
jgi:hypothetical protein